MASADELAAWLRLLETPGVGRGTARRLLAACGSPEAVLSASQAVLRELVGPQLAKALATPPPDFTDRLQAACDWLAGGPDRQLLALGDPAYPPALLQTADPPLLLYLQGDLACLSAPAVAVVGTGLDRVYPARHRKLAHRIAAQGVLVSEFAPGTPPLPEHFPMPNRIIAVLSQGTLVVDAALQSGSLITARLASECGREVFAIPGSIHSPQSRGCHALIQQGAKLVESPQDVTEELRGSPGTQATLPLDGGDTEAGSEPVDPLLEALGHEPVTLDALMARTGWSASELSVRLMSLELEGRTARLPGGLYQRLQAG